MDLGPFCSMLYSQCLLYYLDMWGTELINERMNYPDRGGETKDSVLQNSVPVTNI